MNGTIAKKALMRTCRQLEICGFCPYEEDNRLNKVFDSCPTARKYGTYGCHNCIRKYFLKEVAEFEKKSEG